MDLRALVDKDVSLTETALAKVKLAPPPRSHLRKVAEDFLEMARAYFEDAKHFRERGELEKALANVNYAHGWLDAGARVGCSGGRRWPCSATPFSRRATESISRPST